MVSSKHVLFRSGKTFRRPAVLILGLVALVLTGGLALNVLAEGGYTGPNPTVSDGPDVTVWAIKGHFGNLSELSNWTPGVNGAVSGIRAYSIGTDSCNIGSALLNWCSNGTGGGCAPGLAQDQHPVIAQNIYRLKSGRLEQIGKSWLKHGFFATNSFAGTSCQGKGSGGAMVTCQHPSTGSRLGIGCTDFYDADLNGSQNENGNDFDDAGARSEIDARAGEILVYPPELTGPINDLAQRVQVAEADLDPANNSGALYWAEGHYVAEDDAAAGNAFNNASYRQIQLEDTIGWDLEFSDIVSSTVREAPAIYAWKAQDPLVQIVSVDVPTHPIERFHVAYKATEVTSRGELPWHYEIAIHNMNSDRAARALELRFPPGTLFSSQGFRDVNSHSGEVWSSTDWQMTENSGAGTIRWETTSFATNANANALRWATMYSFWFNSDQPPSNAQWILELFKPGWPTEMDVFNSLFLDGFESGTVSRWSSSTP